MNTATSSESSHPKANDRSLDEPTPVRTLDDLDLISYNPENRGERAQGGESCTICLEVFERGDMVKLLPCLHVFHNKCIEQWVRQNYTCPTCNAQVIMPMATPVNVEPHRTLPRNGRAPQEGVSPLYGICRDCNRQFYRDPAVSPSTAQYFRCENCRSNFTSRSIADSCCVC